MLLASTLSIINLAELTIPNAITSLPKYSVNNSIVPVLVIPNSVTSIAKTGLYQALGRSAAPNRLCVLSIPEGITSLDTQSLDVDYVDRLSIPKDIKEFTVNVIGGPSRAKRLFLPDTMTSIVAGNISNMYSLEKIKLPSSLVSLGNSCLYDCFNLTEVNIPDSVTEIGTNPFYNCCKLRSLRIPAGIATAVTFSSSAKYPTQIIFYGPNTGLNYHNEVLEVIYHCDSAPASLLVPNGFCSVYVPDELYDAFYAATSSDFKGRIRKHSEYIGVLPT